MENLMTADFQGLGYRRANRWFRGRYPAVARWPVMDFACAGRRSWEIKL